MFDVKVMAEIGVWKGELAEALLSETDVERYYMVDPWTHLEDWNKPFNVDTPAFDAVYAEAMTRTEFAADRRIVLRGETKDVVEQLPALDLAYIDGDHTLRGITIDLISLLPKIKAGGLIGGDDFVPSPWKQHPGYEPTMVCPFALYFAEAADVPIVALPGNQFLLQKTHGFSFTDLTGKYGSLSLRLPSAWERLRGKLQRFLRA